MAAQRYGGNWGFLLPTGGALSSSDNEAGAPYDELLPSGHYVVGVDIPAGLYTITAEKGEGRLFTALGVVDENLIAQGGPDTICGFEDVSLAVGDTLTATARVKHQGKLTGVYDIEIQNQQQKTVALFRGKSHRIGGSVTGEA